jgi:serine/threonine protein phosphatase PrpC
MLKLKAGSLTHPGMIREENEDSVWSQIFAPPKQSPSGLFIVCDGMGGHMGGKYASYWAVEAIKSEFGELLATKDPRATVVLTAADVKAVREGNYVAPEPNETDLEKITKSAIQKANKVVFDYSRHKPKQAANAGTTIAMAALRGKQVFFANVGDSRGYLLRDHELVQVTRDHSLVANLVTEGQILPEEIYTHPRRNMIFRFLGQKGLVQIDIFEKEIKPGDYILLCSDGLWEMIHTKEKIVDLIENAKDPQDACQMLVEAANAAGGEDNIGVVVVQIN